MKRLLPLIFLFLLSFVGRSSHIAGGEITYKYMGNNTFDVTFKLYRDCRGGGISAPKFELMDVSTGKYLTLTPTLVSIRDISNLCKSDTVKCSPPNKIISTSKPVFEEHIYSYTLDFDRNESYFKNSCLLKLGMGECCRSNAITTGGSGNNFWVTSSLNLCQASNNSSPVFSFNPNFTLCCNQSAYISFNAIDTIDGDSISYSWVEPLQAWTSKVTWASGRSYNSPMDDYWPPGYNKAKGPNPNVSPPIGTYLDPQSGMLYFTPTDCSEITKMAVLVKEWRKDSTGKYIQIGEIIKDMTQWVIVCPNNNPPLINGGGIYQFCEGTPITLDFKTDDKQFIPPPPQNPGQKDTTTIVWNYGIKGALFKNINDTARLKTGRFTWTPPVGSASTLPYYFTFKVTDNACPNIGFSYRTVGIRVMEYLKINHELQKLEDNVYIGKGSLDTSMKIYYTQNWQVYDSFGGYIRTNSFNQSFYSANHIVKQSDSKHSTDTIIFLKNGKYIIRHYLSAPYYCSNFIYDTIVVKNIKMEVSLLSTIDTSVCQYSKFRLYAKVNNGQAPFKYQWKKEGKITADTVGYIDFDGLNTAFYEVEVIDVNKQINSTSSRVWISSAIPKFKIGNDTTICPNSNLKLKVIPLTKKENIVKWFWMQDSVIVSTLDSFKTKTAGIYIVKAQNTSGCIAYDTIKISVAPNTKPQLISRQYCQNKNELVQNEIILKPFNINVYQKMEWSVLKSLRDKIGVLNPVENFIKDMDTTSGYDFKIVFGKDIIDLGVSKKDSLKLVLSVTDSFHCLSKDTITLVLLKSPEIVIANQSYCRNNAIDLSQKIKSNLPVKIVAENRNGFDDWPIEGEIINGLLKAKYFKPDGGNYFLRISSSNEMCVARDSINLIINPSPAAYVGIQFIGDSVKFSDNSKYCTSRNWYVNTIFKTNSKEMVLTRAAAHLKSIKLELKNADCGFDTTFSIKTLAIENPKNEIIKIYPNPANQTLTLETSQTKPYKIEILNTLGQSVMSKRIHLATETIDVSNLSKGVYNLVIEADNKISRVRFVKE